MAQIQGGDRSDFLNGTDGDDSMSGGRGHDVLNGGRGADNLSGGEGHDTLIGGDGNDVLHGGEGHDSFFGGAGDDRVWARTGDIYLDGGSGVDTLFMEVDSARPLDFSIAGPRPVSVAGLTFTGMERLGFSAGGGDDRVFGGDYDDRISGRAGEDRLFGLNGADWLVGGEGDDILQGMHDNDQLDGEDGDDELTGGGADDRLNGGDGVDIARFGAHSSNYRFERGESGLLRVIDTRAPDPARPGSQTDGTDTLQDVEFLQFTDRRISIADVLASIRPPVARPDAATTNEDARVTFNLLSNDSDPDGDALSVLTVNPTGLKGSISLGANGAVTYTPGVEHQALGAGETAVETFTYLLQDAGLNTAQGTATVTVTGINDAPRAAPDSFDIGEDDAALDVTARLLANDRDPDRADTLTIAAVQGKSASGATVTLSADGRVSYDPGDVFQNLGLGETATDTFSYTVRDSAGLASTALATVTVRGAADEEGDPLHLMIMEDEVTGNLLERLTEEVGVVRVTSVNVSGALGDVALSQDGTTLTYSAEALDSLQADSTIATRFSWTGVTANGVVKKGYFSIHVGGVNDPVTAVDDAMSVTEGQATGNLWTTLLSNDIDPEGAVHTRQILGVDTTGTLGVVQFDQASRSLIYIAPDLQPGETRTDSFRYTAHESEQPNGQETTAVVTVTVTGGPAGAAAVSIESAPLPDGEDAFNFDLTIAVEAGGEPVPADTPVSGFGAASNHEPAAGYEGLAALATILDGSDAFLI